MARRSHRVGRLRATLLSATALLPSVSGLHIATAERGKQPIPPEAAAAVAAAANAVGGAAPPPPMQPPTAVEAQQVAAAAQAGTLPDLADTADVLEHTGEAPLVPKALADRAAELAAKAIDGIFPGLLKPAAAGPAPAAAAAAAPGPAPAMARPPRQGPPRPPACAVPPRELKAADAQMALPPFRPAGATGDPKRAEDGASVWKLTDGGWAFQYDDMAARIGGDNVISVAWPEQQYAVRMDEDGISYHKGQTVIHRSVDGDLVYHQPTGTIHQEGDTVIYHWCNPNLVVYHTPSGIIYYDNDGMTYRGNGGIAHYARDGDLVYQGVGGVTRHAVDGTVTHWTDSGAIFQHPDGTLTYTPVGEKESYPLSPDVLGADPFPGPPLTEAQVLALAHEASLPLNTGPAADAAVAAASASNGAHTADNHARDVRHALEQAKRDAAEHAAEIAKLGPAPAPVIVYAPAPSPAMAPQAPLGMALGPSPAMAPSPMIPVAVPGMVPRANPLLNKVEQLKHAAQAADAFAKAAAENAAAHMAGAAPSPGAAWGAYVGSSAAF